jgi:hypothetical protein
MLQRISPHLSTGGYFVLDDVYQWSGAKNAYLDYFGVKYEWLEQYVDQAGCWTVVRYPDGTQGYFRLMLDVRAFAQAIAPLDSSETSTMGDTLLVSSGGGAGVSYPKCSPPPPPPPNSTSTTSTSTSTSSVPQVPQDNAA